MKQHNVSARDCGTLVEASFLQAILSSQMPTPCFYDLTLHEMCQAEVAW